MDAPLNPSAQDHWPRAFARTIDQVRGCRENPALWARFLAAGAPWYHDRWTLFRSFAGALLEDAELTRRVAADPRACERANALLQEGALRAEWQALARTAHERLQAARADAPYAPCPGPPGHVRVIVELPRRRFVVEDLVVSTTIEERRPFLRGEQLAQYASAVRSVEHVLAARVHPWLCLPGDDPPPVIDALCLAASPNPIGRPDEPEAGHSLGLGLCVAALSHRLGWTLRHDRVVLSGTISSDTAEGSLGRVGYVAHIREKLEAVIRWLESEGRGGPAAPCDVFIPEHNLEEARPLLVRLEELGARVHPERHLEQVLDRLPVRVPREAPVGRSVDGAVCVLAFLWWAERLVGGEYLPDPFAQAHHAPLAYTAVSAVPALLPALAMALLLRTSVAGSVRNGAARIAGLTLVMMLATGAMFAIQWGLGGFAFPGDYDRRVGCVVKDSVVIYAAVAALFMIHPLQVQRMGARAWLERGAGRVVGKRWATTRQWADQIRGVSALVQRNIVEVGLVMMAMLGGEFVKSLGGNRWYAPHIAFQILMPVLIGMLVVHACTLPGSDPRPRAYRLRIS